MDYEKQLINDAYKKALKATGIVPPSNWEAWQSEAETYPESGVVVFQSVNPERKWEISSALQKSIRRGDRVTAIKMVSALKMIMTGTEYAWRRIVVTAAEDIGPANIPLMTYVMLMADALKKLPIELQTRAQCALVGIMADQPIKSRIYCSYSIIHGSAKPVSALLSLPELTEFDHHILQGLEEPSSTSTAIDLFLAKKNWTSEGMAIYATKPSLGETSSWVTEFPLEPVVVAGLPDYAYDMHTRVGQTVLAVLKKTSEPISKWLDSLGGEDPRKLLGYALFYAEGGLLLPQSYGSLGLSILEFKAVLYKFKSPAKWAEFFEFIGRVRDEKDRLLELRQYYCKKTYGG